MGDRFAGIPSWYLHPGQLSLAILQWVSAMSAVDGFGHRYGRNSELRLTIGREINFTLTDYRQHCAQRKSAGISFTQRPILRFFAPQGRHVAPMGVKFGMEDGTSVPSSMPHFTPIGATTRV